jgi:hypothetical protein
MHDASGGRSELTLQSGAYVWPTVLFLAAGFALANGMGYGSGNLRQYLLHALRGLDPSFLANDWFTSQTRAHHAAFNALIVQVGRVVSLDVFFAAANAAFAAVFVICIHLLASRLYRAPIVVTAIAVLCWAFGPPSLIGMTTLLNSYFQPSTIGAVGLLAGLTSMIRGRYRLAGLVLGAAALFHINYMVWIVVILSIVVAINFRTLGWRQAAFLVTPAALAAAYHLPFFLAGKSPEQAACSVAAARILHDIYMPCHSRPLSWGIAPFLQFGAVMAAGGISLMTVGVELRPSRIAKSIIGAIAGIVLVGTILTTAVQIDLVALLFPIRLAPFLVLAAVITTAGAIAMTAQHPFLSPVRTLMLWLVLGTLLYCGGVSQYGLLCLGTAASALFAGRLARESGQSAVKMVALLAGVAIALYLGGIGKAGTLFVAVAIAGAVYWRILSTNHGGTETRRRGKAIEPDPGRDSLGRDRHSGIWSDGLLFAGAAVPLLVAALLMQSGSVRKDLMGPPPAMDEQVLYNWCRARTDRGDIFIIPPLLGDFRQGAQRAVVIDWKCMPILPKDTVEWYRRLADECGVEFDSLPQAEAGYADMNADRARRLADAYGARYLIVDRSNHKGDLSRLRRVYDSAGFAVFDLRDGGHGDPSTGRDSNPAATQ